MNKNTISYLKSKEWSMGNGQCPECYGHKPRNKWWTDTVGHKSSCVLAKVLLENKISPVYERPNHSKERANMNRFFKNVCKKIGEKQC